MRQGEVNDSYCDVALGYYLSSDKSEGGSPAFLDHGCWPQVNETAESNKQKAISSVGVGGTNVFTFISDLLYLHFVYFFIN